MMKLRHSSTSPFARKVLIAAMELGVDKRIELVPSFPFAADTDLPRDNPLGKLPALVLEDGTSLYDSPVICEYLDWLTGGRLFPAAGPARWTALRRQALADGILDSAVLRLLEGRRPAELQSSAWVERQKAAMDRALDVLEGEAPDFGDGFDIGLVTVASALGYIDFRFVGDAWRNGRPRLTAWFAAVSQRPSVAATVPHDPA